jgi:hypothetical protein
MDLDRSEVLSAEEGITYLDASARPNSELDDLQLALLGGGMGDVIAA